MYQDAHVKTEKIGSKRLFWHVRTRESVKCHVDVNWPQPVTILKFTQNTMIHTKMTKFSTLLH